MLISPAPVARRARSAIEAVEGGKELLDPGIGDPVPEGLALAPERHDALFPHLGKVLRQGRLRQAHGVGEGVHAGLAPLHELAQDHQAALVGEGAENARHLGRLLLEAFQIQPGNHRPQTSLHSLLLI
jgi:hypothetical protein